MKPEDKKKLQDAFKKSIEKNPDADKPIPGFVLNDGTPATQRKLLEAALKDESVYAQIDKLLAQHPELSFDKWLKKAFTPAPKP